MGVNHLLPMTFAPQRYNRPSNARGHHDPSMTLLTTFFPLICYFAYNIIVPQVEKRRPSLSVIMNLQRRRWVANAALRESPFDAILLGNIMDSVSFPRPPRCC